MLSQNQRAFLESLRFQARRDRTVIRCVPLVLSCPVNEFIERRKNAFSELWTQPHSADILAVFAKPKRDPWDFDAPKNMAIFYSLALEGSVQILVTADSKQGYESGVHLLEMYAEPLAVLPSTSSHDLLGSIGLAASNTRSTIEIVHVQVRSGGAFKHATLFGHKFNELESFVRTGQYHLERIRARFIDDEGDEIARFRIDRRCRLMVERGDPSNLLDDVLANLISKSCAPLDEFGFDPGFRFEPGTVLEISSAALGFSKAKLSAQSLAAAFAELKGVLFQTISRSDSVFGQLTDFSSGFTVDVLISDDGRVRFLPRSSILASTMNRFVQRIAIELDTQAECRIRELVRG